MVESKELLRDGDLEGWSLARLWRRAMAFRRLREEVHPEDLEEDCVVEPARRALWDETVTAEAQVHRALESARDTIAEAFKSGALPPSTFRARWESLGFDEAEDRSTSAADDFLEGLFAIPKLVTDDERPPFGQVNLASRARKMSEFLRIIRPGPEDVVWDVGSGNGKFALAVAASTEAQVRGLEYGPTYVEAANRTVERFGIPRTRFYGGDAREAAALFEAEGNVFYLFHPFYGEVAEAVAALLAALAKKRDIRVFIQGAKFGFGEYFERHVASGAWERWTPAGGDLALDENVNGAHTAVVFRSVQRG